MLTSLFTEKLSRLFIRMEYTVAVGANRNICYVTTSIIALLKICQNIDVFSHKNAILINFNVM